MIGFCARVALWIVVWCGSLPLARTQNQEPPAAEQPAYQYFSGTVVSHDVNKITVDRTVLGTNSSSRSFVISKETQVDGKLRDKVRVTVQFVTREEIDHAVRIVVRAGAPGKK